MKKIQTRILLPFLAILIAAFLITIPIMSVMNINATLKLLNDTSNETIAIASERIVMEIANYESTAKLLGTLTSFTNEELPVEQRLGKFNDILADQGIARGNLMDKNGICLATGNDYSDRDYFKAAIQGNVIAADPVISQVTGQPVSIIAAPLWKGGEVNSEIVGIVALVPSETFLSDMVTSVRMTPNTTSYIINKNGDTIAHPNQDAVANQQNIEKLAQSDKSLKGLAEVHALARGGATNSAMVGDQYISYAPIANTDGWSIVLSTPSMDFLKDPILAIVLGCVLAGLAIIIGIIVVVPLVKRITKPISDCTNRLILLSHGDMQTPVPTVSGQDEVAQLAQASTEIVLTTKAVIDDIDYLLGEMSNKNFNVHTKIPDSYVGGYSHILTSMQNIKASLSTTFTNINIASDQVSIGSSQVADSAQILAEGATEQASSIEHLSITLNDVSQQISNTSQNATIANEHSRASSEILNNCDQQSDQLLVAMDNISGSANKISKIMKEIDDISFQTNILALNAAVEAARAGQEGKGFAVVAEEVRNLAQKSALSAKTIEHLIVEAIQAVEEGTLIADNTVKSIKKVIVSANEVTENIDKIATATTNQNIQIENIAQEIDQISSVIQTNSATAEESAAASEQLSGQSNMLKDLVSEFQLSSEY